jgi:ATP-dependent DNA ligase
MPKDRAVCVAGNRWVMELTLPVEPMLARLARQLPVGDTVIYEPKWDGFRCLAFRPRGPEGDVDLRSRNQRPLARYFPEVVEAVRALPHSPIVLDGELLVIRGGRADFAALMSRLHPAASRVALLARETPARFVVFDLIAVGDEVLLDRPFAERRRRLQAAMAGAEPPLQLSPSTSDPAVARAWLAAYSGSGIDGVVAKDLAGLVWAANAAAIELHPYLARAEDLHRPTVVVFDLDPGPPADLLAQQLRG